MQRVFLQILLATVFVGCDLSPSTLYQLSYDDILAEQKSRRGEIVLHAGTTNGPFKDAGTHIGNYNSGGGGGYDEDGVSVEASWTAVPEHFTEVSTYVNQRNEAHVFVRQVSRRDVKTPE